MQQDQSNSLCPSEQVAGLPPPSCVLASLVLVQLLPASSTDRKIVWRKKRERFPANLMS